MTQEQATGTWSYEFCTYAFSHGSGFVITEAGTPGGMAYVPREREKAAQKIVRACNSYDALRAACELTASIFTTEPMDAADHKDAAARIDAAIAAARAALSLAEQTK